MRDLRLHDIYSRPFMMSFTTHSHYHNGMHLIREHVNQTRGRTLCITMKVTNTSFCMNSCDRLAYSLIKLLIFVYSFHY
jgi:hypothetical protein